MERKEEKKRQTESGGKRVLFMRGAVYNRETERGRKNKTIREGWEEELKRKTSAEKQKDR